MSRLFDGLQFSALQYLADSEPRKSSPTVGDRICPMLLESREESLLILSSRLSDIYKSEVFIVKAVDPLLFAKVNWIAALAPR